MWPGKISYSLSTPTKGVIFGTAIKIDFKLIPLVKGLGIGQVMTELVETLEQRIPTPKKKSKRNKTSRTILSDKWRLPQNAVTEQIDGQDAYLVQRLIQLPKSLRHCTQSADSMGIRISHRLYFSIELINPDRHGSEVQILTI